jgi:hypothetical protein
MHHTLHIDTARGKGSDSFSHAYRNGSYHRNLETGPEHELIASLEMRTVSDATMPSGIGQSHAAVRTFLKNGLKSMIETGVVRYSHRSELLDCP